MIGFEDIVELWLNNSDKTIIAAYRDSIRRRKDIPDAVKDLLCGTGENNSGLIMRQWGLIQQTNGNIELAYRRGGG